MSAPMTRAEVFQLQRTLLGLGFLKFVADVDGKYGPVTHSAVQLAEDHYGLPISPPFDPAHVSVPEELLYDLGVRKPFVTKPIIINQIATIGAVLDLLKGKTVTKDQIEGIIRLVLGLLGGFFVAKGVGTQAMWDWIAAGALTAVPALWSWWSNRPKEIVPLKPKA